MRNGKLTHKVDGCSILAKTSQGRNKFFPKVSRPSRIMYGGSGPVRITIKILQKTGKIE